MKNNNALQNEITKLILPFLLLLFVRPVEPINVFAESMSMDQNLSLVIPVEYLRCQIDADCTLVPEVCGRGWRAINATYKMDADKIVSKKMQKLVVPILSTRNPFTSVCL